MSWGGELKRCDPSPEPPAPAHLGPAEHEKQRRVDLGGRCAEQKHRLAEVGGRPADLFPPSAEERGVTSQSEVIPRSVLSGLRINQCDALQKKVGALLFQVGVPMKKRDERKLGVDAPRF